jgi:hypothetical protein
MRCDSSQGQHVVEVALARLFLLFRLVTHVMAWNHDIKS